MKKNIALWHQLSLALGALSALAFVIFPTQSMRNELGLEASLLSNPTFLFALLLVFAGLAIWMKPALPPIHLSRPRSEISNIGNKGLLILTVLLVLRMIWDSRLPLHWEENYHFIRLLNDPFVCLNPFLNHEHHAVSNLLSFLSTKLLGLSKWSMRLPSILLSIAFVLYLSRKIPKDFGWLAFGLVLVHFLVNRKVLWYMHSMRGYIPLMFLAAFFLFQALSLKKQAPAPRKFLLPLAFLLSISHGFGVLFLAMLVGSLTVWAVLNRRTLTPSTLDSARSLITTLLLMIPLWGALAYFQSKSMHQLGDFFHRDPVNWTVPFLRLFGYRDGLSLRIFLCTLAGLYFARLSSGYRLRSDFLGLFLVFTSVFIYGIVEFLHIRQVEGRFFLPFLLPLLLWMVEAVRELRGRMTQALGAFALGMSFVLLPLRGGAALEGYLTSQITAYSHFVEEVKARIDESSTCLTYSGSADETHFSSQLHFRNYKKEGPCRKSYLLHFPSEKGLKPNVSESAVEIYKDSEGRTLYQTAVSEKN